MDRDNDKCEGFPPCWSPPLTRGLYNKNCFVVAAAMLLNLDEEALGHALIASKRKLRGTTLNV